MILKILKKEENILKNDIKKSINNLLILNRLYYDWWKNIDKTIFLLIIFLWFAIVFPVVSTSLIASDKLDTNNYFFFFKHLAFIFTGILILIFFSLLSEKKLFKISGISFFYLFIFFVFSANHWY